MTHAVPTRLERLQAFALAVLCSVLFLRGALWPGQALVPHPPELLDVGMAEAVAAGRFDAAAALRGNIGQGDKYWQTLCWDRVLQSRWLAGEVPRWTRDIGGGAPVAAQMAQPWHPVGLLLWLWPSEQVYGWSWFVQQVLFAYLAYGFVRRLGCAHGPGLVALVAAALGMWTQCKLHHSVVLTAALSVWPMLSAVQALVVENRVGAARTRAIGWLALWTGASWSAGFPIVSAFVTWLTIAFAGWSAGVAARWRNLGPVAAGLGLGGLLAAATMLPILFAHTVSLRRAEHTVEQLAASRLEANHLLTLAWPDLFARASDHITLAAPPAPPCAGTRPLWSQLLLLAPTATMPGGGGHGPVETWFAVGLMSLAFVALAWSLPATRSAAWFFGLVALSGFGGAAAWPPFATLQAWLPGLDAGNVRRALCLLAVALPVLAALGAEAWWRGARRWPAWLVLASVAGVSLAALVWLGGERDAAAAVRAFAELAVLDAQAPWVRAVGGDATALAQQVAAVGSPGEALHNRDAIAATAWRALVVAGLAAAALAAGRRALPACLALAIAELLSVGWSAITTVPAAQVTVPPRVLQPLLGVRDEAGVRPRLARLTVADAQRVDAALPGNFPGFLGLEDASFYSPLAPQRQCEFFAAIEPDRPGKADVLHGTSGFGAFHDVASLSHPLCDLFGIAFVLTRDPVPASAQLVERTPPGTGGFLLLERTAVLPRATFVHDVDLCVGRDERLALLRSPARAVARRIVLEDPAAPAAEPAPPRPARVTVRQHRDEQVVVHVDTDAAGYLRLADPFDAGWSVAVDGEPRPLWIADHCLRAVFVERGAHEVVFAYDAPRVLWPERLGAAALLLTLLSLSRRRRRPA